MREQKFELTSFIKDKKGNILSIGKNNYIKTHPKMIKIANSIGQYNSKKEFIHSEIDAIIKCKNLEKAYRIEVFRLDRRKERYLCSMPCIICATGISETPIKEVMFCNSENEFEIVSPQKLLEILKLKNKG